MELSRLLIVKRNWCDTEIPPQGKYWLSVILFRTDSEMRKMLQSEKLDGRESNYIGKHNKDTYETHAKYWSTAKARGQENEMETTLREQKSKDT